MNTSSTVNIKGVTKMKPEDFEGNEGHLSSPSSYTPAPIDRERIGRYEIIYPISQGGMAGVYSARLTGIAGFQRLVAVKIIHSHLSADVNFIKMFLDEARLSAGIHHPNVGEVFEVGEDDGVYYMVCELILGQSLTLLQRRAKQENVYISPVLYARIISSTALALQAAHDLADPDGKPLKLVHRDVSPRNILLTYEGFVKLIDFGVAYAKDRLANTDVGTVKGKLAYMSPEQLKCDPLDRRSDIFSLGVVLYQFVTGRSPFSGGTDFERIERILSYQFKRPREINPGISPQLEEIIMRAMAYYPEDRYPTAADMSVDLEAFVRSSGESAEPEMLSRIMRSLFKRERAQHAKRIRALKSWEDLDEQTPIVDKETQKLRVNAPGLPGVGDALHSDDTKRPRKRIAFIVKATAVAVVAAGVVLLAYFVMFSKVSHTWGDIIDNDSNQEKTDRPTVVRTDIVPLEIPKTGDDPVSTSEVTISLAISPPHADVEVDSLFIDAQTRSMRLSADGRVHHLRVSADGYFEHEESIVADVDKTVSVALVPLPEQSRTKRKHKLARKHQTKAHRTGHPAEKPKEEADLASHAAGKPEAEAERVSHTSPDTSSRKEAPQKKSPLLEESPYR